MQAGARRVTITTPRAENGYRDRSALIHAASSGDLDTVKVLLEAITGSSRAIQESGVVGSHDSDAEATE